MSIYPNQLAADYIRQGFAPIPVRYKSKEPSIKGWTELAVTETNCSTYFKREPSNIGVLTGTPSGNLVDVDIDDPDALRFAGHFLPVTNCIFGRRSKPSSHWLYRVPNVGSRETFDGDRMIIEVRGDKHHTVFPGSVHPSGERIEFETGDDHKPAFSSWSELKEAARRIAVATTLYKQWNSGSRHELALSSAALLARQGWRVDDVLRLISAVASEAGDTELPDRLRCVETTFARFRQGEAITGDEQLIRLLGPDTLSHLKRWLGNQHDALLPPRHETEVEADLSNDANAADALAAEFKHKLIYSDGKWYQRKDQVYEPVEEAIIQGLAKTFFQAQVAKNLNGFAISPLSKCLARSRINAAIELSRSKLHVASSAIDRDIDLLGCADGSVLDLHTGLATNDLDFVVTKRIGASVSPQALCPTWSAFLEQIFEGDAAVIDFIRRAVGYSLTGSVQEQCLVILVGTGANGKSTFCEPSPIC